GKWDQYPLPNKGTFCYAGCGSAVASMILSTYVDSSFIPPKVIGMYAKKGYYLGVNGSSIEDGRKIVESQGVETSKYIFSGKLWDAHKVAPMFKQYIDDGWTIYAVANFCQTTKNGDGGCGHLFWVVDVDQNGTIWANDPAYGQKSIPLNENKKFPWPLYKAAVAVKKG
ncbi:MAG: hypothetical protein ABIO02_01435, partial [Patescibacteria group bacterium]